MREAAAKGANVVLLQELFETPYFCQDQTPKHFALAAPFEGNPLISEMSSLASELGVVLPDECSVLVIAGKERPIAKAVSPAQLD